MDESEMSKNAGTEKLLDPDEFAMFENLKSGETDDVENVKGLTGDTDQTNAGATPHDMNEFLSTRLVSTMRPLVTTIEEDEKITYSESEKLSPELGPGDVFPLINTGADSQVAATVQTFDPIGDNLSIDSTSGIALTSHTGSSCEQPPIPTVAFEKFRDNVKENVLSSEKLPKISADPDLNPIASERIYFAEHEETAHCLAQDKSSAMEGELVDTGSKTDCSCPFSPCVWFSPEKLHPVVADLVYWRDVKKTGIFFGLSFVLLLSLKYFSVISVVAYHILAILSITVSFRVYKEILQAVQKSHEGHPFKEYLEMNISLSHEKLNEVSDVVIHHVNNFTRKMRSLILVEDLFDTVKLLAYTWCLTYVGAWLNGMTVVILAFVSIFTLPKVYEINKVQIDAYTNVIRTKGKEVMEMINSKIPLGKKKEE